MTRDSIHKFENQTIPVKHICQSKISGGLWWVGGVVCGGWVVWFVRCGRNEICGVVVVVVVAIVVVEV